MMKQLLFLILVIFVFSPVFAAEDTEKNTVLIMQEKTSYKKALVKALMTELDDETTIITVVDHSRDDISDIDPSDYDAVFITNSGAQAHVRPKVMEWLKANAAQDDNVILHTTQTTNWQPKVEVDSITSASSRKNIDELVTDIAERIWKLF